MDILEAPRAQSLGNNDTTCSVHRRINDVQVFVAQDDILVYHSFLDGLQVVPVHLTANNIDEFLVAIELHVLYLYLVYLVDNTLVVRSKHLCTVVPISLVAIILAGIMRSSHIDTSLTTQLTDGERNLRSRTQALKQVNLDAIG